MTALNNMFNN